MELCGGELIAAAPAMRNMHLLNGELSGAARTLQLPTSHGEFHSMSHIRGQSCDILACSFSSPNRIDIIAVNADALERLQSIALDFLPFRSVWLHTIRTLLVFTYMKSKGGASVLLEAAKVPARVRALQLDDEIRVMSCCRLSWQRQTENVLVFDDATKSVLEFDLS